MHCRLFGGHAISEFEGLGGAYRGLSLWHLQPVIFLRILRHRETLQVVPPISLRVFRLARSLPPGKGTMILRA